MSWAMSGSYFHQLKIICDYICYIYVLHHFNFCIVFIITAGVAHLLTVVINMLFNFKISIFNIVVYFGYCSIFRAANLYSDIVQFYLIQ